MTDLSIAEIKARTDLLDVAGKFMTFKKSGANYIAVCFFHGEKSGSFTIKQNSQKFKCFGCGKHGDVIDLLEGTGMTKSEAIKYLKDPNNNAGIVPGAVKKEYKQPAAQWVQIMPKKDFQVTEIFHKEHGTPTRVFTYMTAEKIVIGYTCRFDLQDGSKQVLPFSYFTNGKQEGWMWGGLGVPRPLYNLDVLADHPNKPIIIVEGEKTADAGIHLFPDHVIVTWIGGAEGVKNADFTPLKGREILFWPDNDKDKIYKAGIKKGQVMDFKDQPGNKAMLAIMEILKPDCINMKWIKNPSWAPCGWDIADAEWKESEAKSYLLDNTLPADDWEVLANVNPKNPDTLPEEIIADTKHDIEDKSGAVPPPKKPKSENPRDFGGIKDGGYFRMLGYQKDGHINLFHFYSFNSKSVISLTPSTMSKPNLLQLAPIDWWEGMFPRAKGGGFEVDEAQNWLIDASYKFGIFNPKWIRGRGAWIDGDHVVIHAGSKLIVDGIDTKFSDFKSKYIYEIAETIGFDLVKPLNTTAAHSLLEMLKLIKWEREVNAHLLAGFCVIAPFCGVLKWRPHIWLTGPAGSGKSWIFTNLLRGMLEETGLAVQGSTTEPGLRQLLRNDALPVIFDEAEGNDKRSQERMAAVLELMRSTSTNDGGINAKGGSGGSNPNVFITRSCFAFASISPQATNQSDKSRISLLGVRGLNADQKKLNEKDWIQLQKMHTAMESRNFAARLRSRTIAMLPTILKNIKQFTAAAAAELGQQRAGDQVGALLAGAYSLASSKEITFEKACEYVAKMDWVEERSLDITKDELGLINHLLSAFTRVESSHGVQERTVGELVRIAASYATDKTLAVDKTQAEERLGRMGMKVKNSYLIIGNSHPELNRILKETPWLRNYNKLLMRLEGAEDMDPTTFASGIKSRATKIPLKSLFEGQQMGLFEALGENKSEVDQVMEEISNNQGDLGFDK